MSKHTPGPWIAGDDDDSDFFVVGPHVDRIVSQPVVKLHSMYDAFLIAAAPELLDALQDLMFFDNGKPEWVAARAAIAKATGTADE